MFLVANSLPAHVVGNNNHRQIGTFSPDLINFKSQAAFEKAASTGLLGSQPPLLSSPASPICNSNRLLIEKARAFVPVFYWKMEFRAARSALYAVNWNRERRTDAFAAKRILTIGFSDAQTKQRDCVFMAKGWLVWRNWPRGLETLKKHRRLTHTSGVAQTLAS